MLGLGAILSSLKFTLGHRIDFLGLFLSKVYFHITEVGEEGRGEGLNLDLASSLELKSVVSSPNKRKKDLRSSGTTTRQKLGLIPGKDNIIIIIRNSKKKTWIFIIRLSLTS